jgi:hypothetical protein
MLVENMRSRVCQQKALMSCSTCRTLHTKHTLETASALPDNSNAEGLEKRGCGPTRLVAIDFPEAAAVEARGCRCWWLLQIGDRALTAEASELRQTVERL